MVVLAIFMAGLLFISNPIPVYAIGVIPIIIIVISSLLGGFTIGWFLNDMSKHEARSPGVTTDSYVSTIATNYAVDVKTLSNYGYTVTSFLERMRLYYARLAEHRVLDYLQYENLDIYEEGVMIDVAMDLCNITNAYFSSLDNALDHLNWLSYDRFTGDLSDYTVYVVKPGAWDSGYPYKADLDVVGDLYVAFEADSEVKLFDCNAKQIVNASAGSRFDLRKYLILAGEGNTAIEIVNGNSGEHEYGYTGIGFHGPNGWIDQIDLGDNLREWHVMDVINYIDSIYDTAWSYAKAYHTTLRGMGYTDKSQVPENQLVTPPDIVFPTPWNLQENRSMSYEEVMAYYAGLLKSMEKFFNESNYRLANYLSHLNVSFPDTREWLKNVIIRFPNGSIWLNATRLIPVWYPGTQTFYPGSDNVLQNPMGALLQLPNGEWIYTQIPSGYMLNPAAVHTPYGESTNPWTLRNYQGGFNPVYEGEQEPEPEMVETMHEVMQLVIALMPLLIILAIVQLIVRLGKRW